MQKFTFTRNDGRGHIHITSAGLPRATAENLEDFLTADVGWDLASVDYQLHEWKKIIQGESEFEGLSGNATEQHLSRNTVTLSSLFDMYDPIEMSATEFMSFLEQFRTAVEKEPFRRGSTAE